MRFYKIKIRRFYDNDMIANNANGENVSIGQDYFYRIGKGEIIENTPVFDCFHLESFDKIKYWELAKKDVHGFIGIGSIMSGWYISNDFKILLENFKIAPKYHFYETKLLYNGEKFKYWIFQIIASYRKLNKMEYIDFSKSIFFVDNKEYYFDSYENWSEINEEVYDKYDEELSLRKLFLFKFFDFLPLNPISSDVLCSERLKQAIEENGITGFEFLELNYEVVVE
jgi:hypothetical protein